MAASETLKVRADEATSRSAGETVRYPTRLFEYVKVPDVTA
jgi:hypothetical protein